MSAETSWMGKLPDNWEVKDLRHIAEVILGLTYSPNDVVTDEDAPLVIRASNVQNGKLVHADDVRVDIEVPPKKMNQIGDVIVCSRNGSRHLIGKSAVLTEEWLGATFGAFMTTVRSPYPEWISWILASDLFKFQSGRFMSSTINQLTTDTLKSFAIPLPPIETQEKIAAFLNEKTAQIDGLIEKKRALLERLAEKRQALITQAVTKGLNPNAVMKDSGIDWLGQVPEHWEVMPLRRVRDYMTSGSRDWAAFYSDEGEPFIRMTNVTGCGIELDMSDLRYVALEGTNEGTRTATRTGDILITITAELGAVAVARAENVGSYINQHLALFRPNKSLCSSDFLANFLSTRLAKAQLELSGQGGTKQGLGFEQINNIIAVFPPLDEQNEIASFCAGSWNSFGDLEHEVSASINLLDEYRAALISSAVTGKLDGLQ